MRKKDAADLDSKRKGNRGRKNINIATLREKLQNIPLKCRIRLHVVAFELEMPVTPLFYNGFRPRHRDVEY